MSHKAALNLVLSEQQDLPTLAHDSSQTIPRLFAMARLARSHVLRTSDEPEQTEAQTAVAVGQ